MKKVFNGLGALALVAALSACSDTVEPANNVVANDMNMTMADPANPFAQSEMTMDQAMTAAVGVTPADSWVRKMIEHHKGAVDMSRIVLTQDPTADVAKMARMTIDMQGQEITDLERLVATGKPNPASAELYRPAAMQMHTAMTAASGANGSETYLRKMLAHHQGAVTMSDVALANGATGAIRARIEKTRESQQREVALVEAMLRGEPMAAAPATPASPPAASATTPSAPRASAATSPPARPDSAKPAPAKPKPAQPAADPHAGHDMNNM